MKTALISWASSSSSRDRVRVGVGVNNKIVMAEVP